MDWELVGIVTFVVYAGLTVAVVAALGLTRVEKLLAGSAMVGMLVCVAVMMFATSAVVGMPDTPDISEVDAWMARWNTLGFVAKCFWWVAVTAGTLFLAIATLHAWRQPSNLLRPLKSLRSPGATRSESATRDFSDIK